MSRPDLSGQVALVTGGTKGLGRGLAEAFLAAGATVWVCARHEPEHPVEVDGVRARVLTADLRDSAAASDVVARAGEAAGLQVVVNNAGGSPPVPAADASPRFLEKIVALNLLAPLYVAQAAHAVMRAQTDGGLIINIGSLSGRRPSPGTAAYGAAKAGLANLTASLAMEWAPLVRVNQVTVGYLATEDSAAHYGDDAGVAAVAATMPMGRLVRPEDVAEVCLFLAAPQAYYLTGADIEVHGGGERPAFLTAQGR